LEKRQLAQARPPSFAVSVSPFVQTARTVNTNQRDYLYAQFAGTEPLDDSSQSIDKQAEALERLAISNGMLFARAGCLNSKESPAIQNARTMVAARRKATGNHKEAEQNASADAIVV